MRLDCFLELTAYEVAATDCAEAPELRVSFGCPADVFNDIETSFGLHPFYVDE
jgi:hypothetical protein